MQKQEEIKHRVITMLSRKELEFLDKLGKDSLFSTGHKLTYNEILKALTDFAMQMQVSGEKVDSADNLRRKMFEQMWKKVEEQLKQMDSKREEQNREAENEKDSSQNPEKNKKAL